MDLVTKGQTFFHWREEHISIWGGEVRGEFAWSSSWKDTPHTHMHTYACTHIHAHVYVLKHGKDGEGWRQKRRSQQVKSLLPQTCSPLVWRCLWLPKGTWGGKLIWSTIAWVYGFLPSQRIDPWETMDFSARQKLLWLSFATGCHGGKD